MSVVTVALLTSFLASAVAASAATPPEGRAYEQVTPTEKGSSVVESRYMNALPDGSGVRYMVRGVPAEAEGSPLKPRFVSFRDADGWSHWLDADPPFRAPPWLITFQTTLAVSDDGHHAFVVSNRALAPGAVEAADAANLYVEDLRTGSFSWVGTVTGQGPLNSFTGSIMDKYVGGAPDFGWVLFFSEYPLLAGVSGWALYRWSASGGLEVVSLLPGGEVPDAPVQRLGFRDLPRQASSDGRRVFFGLEGGAVYVRESGVITPVSMSKLDGTVQAAEFIDSDVTGRYVFYVSSQPLLASVPAHTGALYRYDLKTGDLVYVGTVYPGKGAHLLAVAADGQSVYYASPQGGELVSWRDDPKGPVSDVIVRGGSDDGVATFVSPSGRYLAFQSSSDVYVYDAEAGQLSCASCLNGEPTGEAELSFGERSFDNSFGQAIDDQGQVFFTSSAPLVPEDGNGVADVYVFAHGEVALISPAAQGARSLFGAISEDGDDVFFVTAASLVAQDRDRQPDLYDARVGGGIPSQDEGEVPGCSGESCQPPTPGAPPEPAIGGEGGALSKAAVGRRRHCQKGKRRCAAKRGGRAVGRWHPGHRGKRQGRPAG